MEKLLAHRWTSAGFEFQVRWAGERRKGVGWDDSWEPVSDISDDLVDAYFSKIELCEKKQVTIDVSPLLENAREKVARAVKEGKVKCRPRVHEVDLELPLKEMGLAFLGVPGG